MEGSSLTDISTAHSPLSSSSSSCGSASAATTSTTIFDAAASLILPIMPPSSYHLPWLAFPRTLLSSDEPSLDDPDDYISSLAHQIAHSMLDDDDASQDSSSSFLPSPQVALNPVEAQCCGWSLPETDVLQSSQLSSPRGSLPASLPLDQEDAWDLLCNSENGVLELKLGGDRKGFAAAVLPSRAASSRASQRQQTAVCLNVSSGSLASQKRGAGAPGSTLFSRENLAPAMLKNMQRSSSSSAKAREEDSTSITNQKFRASKQGAAASWGGRGNRPLQHSQTNRGASRHRGGGSPQRSSWGGAPDINSSHHFPPIMSGQNQQQQPQHREHQQQSLLGNNSNRSSGMRAIFLGATGSRESGGTGVFLPRRMGCGPESKKKPACSTVLLPSRVVQALNLKVEDILSCPGSSPTSPITRRDFSSPVASSLLPTKSPKEDQCWEVAPEISLPTEWTY